MVDLEACARDLIDRIEQGDIESLRGRLGARLRGWDPAPWLADEWWPVLDELVGGGRAVGRVVASRTDPIVVTVAVHGDAGATTIGVGLDDDGRLLDLIVGQRPDGIYNIVIGCPEYSVAGDRVEGPPRELGQFYAGLLGMEIIRNDWIKVAKGRRGRPQLGFGGDGWSDDQPPRWPDPDHPQQVHLDLLAADPDAAADYVLAHGGRQLRDGAEHRILADPVGHPLCLRPDGRYPDPVIARVVFDCADPGRLADFYAGLLEMPRRTEQTGELLEISRDDGLPMLAFQRSEHEPPRWPDPRYPAQIHLDLWFNDGPEATARAVALGAVPLSPEGGSSPVLADPGGHPFCLGSPGHS